MTPYRVGWVDGVHHGHCEMLWRVALGACWRAWFTHQSWHPDAIAADMEIWECALHALADLGDEQAREILQ